MRLNLQHSRSGIAHSYAVMLPVMLTCLAGTTACSPPKAGANAPKQSTNAPAPVAKSDADDRIYDIPPPLESLLRLHDEQNASDAKKAMTSFDEVVDASKGLHGKFVANIEAERAWIKTIDSVKSKNETLESAGFVVDSESKWIDLRRGVCDILSVPPSSTQDDLVVRVNIRLHQIELVQKVLARWAEYQKKKVDSASKSLAQAKAILDDAKTLRLPAITWRQYSPKSEGDVGLKINFADMMPPGVTITKIAVTPDNRTAEQKNDPPSPINSGTVKLPVAVSSSTGGAVEVTFPNSYEEKYDFDLKLEYTVGEASDTPKRTATTTLRVFAHDPAKMAWDRFESVLIDAGKKWLASHIEATKAINTRIAPEEQSFLNAAINWNFELNADKKAKDFTQVEAWFLGKLGDLKERTDDRRTELARTLANALVNSFKQKEAKAPSRGDKGKESKNLLEAFRELLKADDPRKDIDAIIQEGADPAVAHALVASLQHGLDAVAEERLNMYIAFLKDALKEGGVVEPDASENMDGSARGASDTTEAISQQLDEIRSEITKNQVLVEKHLGSLEALVAGEVKLARPPSVDHSKVWTSRHKLWQFAVDKTRKLNEEAKNSDEENPYDDGFVEHLIETSLSIQQWQPWSSVNVNNKAERNPDPPGKEDNQYDGGAHVFLDATTNFTLPKVANQVRALEKLIDVTTSVAKPATDGEPPAPVVESAIATQNGLDDIESGSLTRLLLESTWPTEAITFAGTITEDARTKEFLEKAGALVKRLQDDNRAGYIRLGDYIVELQDIRLAALQENIRHTNAFTSILTAERRRWEMVREQARLFDTAYTTAISARSPDQQENSTVLTSVRKQAIAAHKNQVDDEYPPGKPDKDKQDNPNDPRENVQKLRDSVRIINSYLTVRAINTRLGLDNQRDLAMEIKLHSSALESLKLRPQEADIRFLLREQSDLMQSGTTSREMYDFAQSFLLLWIAEEQ